MRLAGRRRGRTKTAVGAERKCAEGVHRGDGSQWEPSTERRGGHCGDWSDAMWGSLFVRCGVPVCAMRGSLFLRCDSVMHVARTIKSLHGEATPVRAAMSGDGPGGGKRQSVRCKASPDGNSALTGAATASLRTNKLNKSALFATITLGTCYGSTCVI